MEAKWSDYPFSDYELRPKTKKAYRFVKVSAVCACGRKGNVKCVAEECSKCCTKKLIPCKAHKYIRKKNVRVS